MGSHPDNRTAFQAEPAGSPANMAHPRKGSDESKSNDAPQPVARRRSHDPYAAKPLPPKHKQTALE